MAPYTETELYEQAKRILREILPQLQIPTDEPFVLACHECGLPFRQDIEIGMVAEHAQLEHDVDPDTDKVMLDLVYVGEGPPPEGPPA